MKVNPNEPAMPFIEPMDTSNGVNPGIPIRLELVSRMLAAIISGSGDPIINNWHNLNNRHDEVDKRVRVAFWHADALIEKYNQQEATK